MYGPTGKDKRGIAKAYDLFFKVSAKHMDAGFYMGEILMGRDPVHAGIQGPPPIAKNVLPTAAAGKGGNAGGGGSSGRSGGGSGSSSGSDGGSSGSGSGSGSGSVPKKVVDKAEDDGDDDDDDGDDDGDEGDAADEEDEDGAEAAPAKKRPGAVAEPSSKAQLQPKAQTQGQPQPRQVAVDPAAAAQSYAVASQRGNMLALHRLAHMSALGIGTARSCPSATNGFKNVAERGNWGFELTEAHRLSDAGERAAALTLFARKAAVGSESAQFNAAYVLMKEPDLGWLRPSPSAERMAAALDKRARATDAKLQEGAGRSSSSSSSSSSSGGAAASEATVDETGNADVSAPADDNSAPSAVDRSRAVGAASAVISALYGAEWRLWAHGAFAAGQASSSSSASASAAASAAAAAEASAVRDAATYAARLREACEARAMVLFALSASQGNAESYLRVGDFYYYGSAGLQRDKFEAAVFYQMAADLRNTHAIFNLGIMHEAGDGVQQDFHLAKRFYDQAAEFDADARTPRALALMLLNSHRSLQEAVGVEATARLCELLVEAAAYVDALRQHGARWFGLGASKRASRVMAGGRTGAGPTDAATAAQTTRRRADSGQWRDLEGIIVDAVRRLLAAGGATFGVKQEIGVLAVLWVVYIYVSRWRQERQDRRRRR